MIITPGMNQEQAANLETSGGHIDLPRIKREIEDVRGEASMYFRRNACALDWWQSRWEGQTVDGRKWWRWDSDADIFPWKGSSDTRVRLTKTLINEYRTIAMYALTNCKLQAQSTRPTASPREAGQATTLLNWQIFNQMANEWHLETELALVWSAAFGSSVMEVQWTQERRLDHTPINVMQFGQFVSKQIGQPLDLLTMQDILESPQHEKELLGFVQDLSPIITKAQARSILNDLRKLRTADIPVPYIFKSQPCLTALRPMIDVFFAPTAYNLQVERWIDRVEYVTETQILDRQETDNYDPGFVKEAIDKKGVYSAENSWAWDNNYGTAGTNFGYNIIRPGNLPPTDKDDGALIELHHFNHYSMDMGVPCLYRTVFHMELDDYAVSGPSDLAHGQMPYHAIRYETDHRPILSSLGIPETTYTWENEQKVQLDARTDRASIALSPPMFTQHSEMDKMAAFKPNARIPMRPGFKPEFAAIPPYDPGSIEVSQDIMARVDRYFYGPPDNPAFRQIRQMQLIDRVMTQFKPIIAQIGQLDDQYLPDDVWLRVTGLPPRPGSRDRSEIQGQYEITMTCDARDLDAEYLLKKAQGLAAILPMDTEGQINRTPIIRSLMMGWDYTLADQALQDPQDASQKEVTDEISKVSLIIGSGVEQPMPPPGSNFNLRLQTLNNIVSQPLTKMKLMSDKPAVAVLENRALYYQRQLQQAQNAQIGRLQVGSATNPQQAPMVAPQLGQQQTQ